MNRSKVEQTIYFNHEKQILLAMHVDDLMSLGPAKIVESAVAELQKEILIREVGRLTKPTDELTYLAKSSHGRRTALSCERTTG